MSRYGKLVDARWIHQRMDQKDLRIQRDLARREERRQLEALVRRLADVYTVDTDQYEVICLVRAAKALLQQLDGGTTR